MCRELCTVLNDWKSYARKLASTIKKTTKAEGNRNHIVKEGISDEVALSLDYRDIQYDPIVMTSVKRKGHVSACTKIYHRLISFCQFCVRGIINRPTDK